MNFALDSSGLATKLAQLETWGEVDRGEQKGMVTLRSGAD